jgi:polysaccharide biosynthesis transport protein
VLHAASLCDGAIVIGRLDLITQSDLMQATVMLSQFNAIGIVANGDRSTKYNYAELAKRNGSVSFSG